MGRQARRLPSHAGSVPHAWVLCVHTGVRPRQLTQHVTLLSADSSDDHDTCSNVVTSVPALMSVPYPTLTSAPYHILT